MEGEGKGGTNAGGSKHMIGWGRYIGIAELTNGELSAIKGKGNGRKEAVSEIMPSFAEIREEEKKQGGEGEGQQERTEE